MGGIRKAVADADCPEAVVEAKRPRRTADGPVLAVDVGNSVTNLGLFEGGELAATWTATTSELLTTDEAWAIAASFLRLVEDGALSEIGGAVRLRDGIVASVVPDLTDSWVTAISRMSGRRPLVVGPGLKTGLKMRYNDPGQLGADRIADLVAAKGSYAHPLIVVDFGTTTNFEVVDPEGAFIGGAIAPGLKLCAKALADAAARLPVVELIAPASMVGKNTREAMQAGIVMGEIARIDGLIDLMWGELGYETDVVATGSDADMLAALSKRIRRVDEYLTLRGLALLHAMNRRD